MTAASLPLAVADEIAEAQAVAADQKRAALRTWLAWNDEERATHEAHLYRLRVLAARRESRLAYGARYQGTK